MCTVFLFEACYSKVLPYFQGVYTGGLAVDVDFLVPKEGVRGAGDTVAVALLVVLSLTEELFFLACTMHTRHHYADNTQCLSGMCSWPAIAQCACIQFLSASAVGNKLKKEWGLIILATRLDACEAACALPFRDTSPQCSIYRITLQ